MTGHLLWFTLVAWLFAPVQPGAWTTSPCPAMGGTARGDAPGVAQAARAQARPAARHNLAEDERRGGHTLARHVGRSDDELRERLRRERNISAASTYTDRETAERVVGETLQRERFQVQDWTRGSTRHVNLTLDYHGDRRTPIGRSLLRGQQSPVPCYDAVIVLKWDAARGDFYVLTTYPEARR
jgi:hypothetical protein